jgi:3-deoxy-D-manno-octulosonate 8-phosphate phosphatase (KDO 8-P phosphatase)
MEPWILKAEKITCLVCDVDGVMTDGVLYLDNQGNEMKAFHVHDGVGLKLLMSAGIHVAVITGCANEIIDHRMRQLGIEHFFKVKINKEAALFELQARLQLDFESIAYIGDDLPDIPLIKQVGLGIAVANAAEAVKKEAVYQTKCSGGRGAIREVCDMILKAQHKTAFALESYLST